MVEWGVFDRNYSLVEVVPLFGPEHEEGPECWCSPVIEQHEATLVIHNSVQ